MQDELKGQLKSRKESLKDTRKGVGLWGQPDGGHGGWNPQRSV